MELKLLVETSDLSHGLSFHLEGRQWALSKTLDIESAEQIPPFTCVSYRWGSDREAHAFFEGSAMSTLTFPALAAAIRSAACNAFWMDVFCVPHQEPARQSTLEHMGYIYSRATEVIVVLSNDTFSVIQNMLHYGSVSEQDLNILEKDEWVSSIWTYQEIVNGGSVRFVSERPAESTPSIECADLFNALGYSLQKWRTSTKADFFATLKAFPNLNVLEDTLADWQIGSYTSRSAFSIFSSMALKHNDDPANYYYAILGTLTQSPQQLKWNANQNLDEKIMSICEQKNDYSFIYTVAVRDEDQQRLWRPQAMALPETSVRIPALLRPVYVWHSWGKAQTGHNDAAGFWLDAMTIMYETSAVSSPGKESISKWLSQPELQYDGEDTLGSTVYKAIRGTGFDGEAAPIIVGEGLVFTSQSTEGAVIARVLISNQIRWTMGAPGLAHLISQGKKQYVPCMFVGSIERLLEAGESVLL